MCGSYMGGTSVSARQVRASQRNQVEVNLDVRWVQGHSNCFLFNHKAMKLETVNTGSTVCIKCPNMSLFISLKEKRCLKVFKLCPILC